MDKIVLLLWRSHNNDQVVHAPIIHVAGAFTDTDETYGAYVAAENSTFNNTNNNINPPPRLARTAFLILCFTSSFPTDTCLPLKLLKGPETRLRPYAPWTPGRLLDASNPRQDASKMLTFWHPFFDAS